LLFYDGPSPPPGIFDDFLTIPSVAKDVSTRIFLSLVQAFPDSGASNIRYVLQSLFHGSFARSRFYFVGITHINTIV